MALSSLREYEPFRLDALGLITILGAPELDQAFGTLRRNKYLELLPSIAPFVVVGNYITKPLSGFVIYNVTDGVMATDISAWFGRWLMTQDLTWNSSTLFISYKTTKTRALAVSAYLQNIVTSIIITSMIVVVAALTLDDWGMANAAAMTTSGILRWFIIHQLRSSMDRTARQMMTGKDDPVKVLCTLPSGRAVTIFASRNVVVNHLLTNPRPSNERLYAAVKFAGWICFGCHLVCLGMAAWLNQMVAIAVLLGSSYMIVKGIGFDNENLAQTLVLKKQHDGTAPDSRSRMYSKLHLTLDEEEGLVAWSLFPQRRNRFWWQRHAETYPNRNSP